MARSNWDLFDTRHCVFKPKRISPQALEAGYWRSYREFYRWGNIFQSAWVHESTSDQLRHLAYAGGWKKMEPLWDGVLRAKRVAHFLPVLEKVLAGRHAQTLEGADLSSQLAQPLEQREAGRL